MKVNMPVTGRERVYDDDVTIISTTDLKGIITYANQEFMDIAGFSEEELIGKNHNIVRHPDVPPEAFQDLWNTVKQGKTWRGIVKNRCKNGDHYWVDAYVTPVLTNGTITGYQSVRTRPKRAAIDQADELYRRIRNKEVTKLPKRRSVFDISVRVRLFAALLLLSLLAVAAGVVDLMGSAQQRDIFGRQEAALTELERHWQRLRADLPAGVDTSGVEQALRAARHDDRGRSYAQAAEAVAATNGTLIIAICITGLVAMLVMGVLLVRTVVRPILTVVGIAKGIAGGNLQQRIEVDTNDEIGQMMQALKLMQARLHTCFGRFTESAAQVSAAAEQLSGAGERATRDMRGQQDRTEQVAAAMNQMTATVQEVANRTHQAADSARVADQEAADGKAVVARSRDAINTLAGEVENTARVVHRLEEDSNNISNIMAVISGIAEQTNLLALNAAIEAARAGDSGRGFAVVADEVRTLAQRTQHSTEEIREVIDHLRGGIADAVAVMERGREQAETAVTESRNTEHSLDRITEAVAAINEMNAQISAALGQQSSAAEEVNHNVVQITELSHETVDSARQIARAGVKLADLAAELQAMMGQFNVGNARFDFSHARAAHLAWKSKLRSYLDGDRGAISREQAVSHRNCVLGKWYYGPGMASYGDLPEMKAIDKPHAELHRTIKEVLALEEEGRHREAEERFRSIESLSKQVVSNLDAVEAKVTRRGA